MLHKNIKALEQTLRSKSERVFKTDKKVWNLLWTMAEDTSAFEERLFTKKYFRR